MKKIRNLALIAITLILTNGLLAQDTRPKDNYIGQNLSKKSLTKVDFSGQNLSGTIFTGANLSEANLSGTDLVDKNLQGTILTKANLSKANLQNCDLSGAILTDTDLSGANLHWATFGTASMQGADLTGANLDEVNLEYALYDSKTKWPEGFNPLEKGAINIENLPKVPKSVATAANPQGTPPAATKRVFHRETGNQGIKPELIVKTLSEEMRILLNRARNSTQDYFWNRLPPDQEPSYELVKDDLPPLRYTSASWKYPGLILCPKGSTQKMRVIENGSRIDANLTRRIPSSGQGGWTTPDSYITVLVGPNDELFGKNENNQGQPAYQDGYIPVLNVTYKGNDNVEYQETVFAGHLLADYRSKANDEPGVAAYIKLTASNNPGQVAFEVAGLPANYGFPIVPRGFRNNAFTDGHNNVFAWFSPGGTYDAKAGVIRFNLKQGESVYAVLPHQQQYGGTHVSPSADLFEKARANTTSYWENELAAGKPIEVPEKVVMDAYRSLLIGNMQMSIADEVPYGMFSNYQGNGYAEILQTLAPFIELGYFEDARRFIQPILEYPLSDTTVGLHVCANRLILATYYYQMSHDKDFILKNKNLLCQIADYFLQHRNEQGLVVDGYGFDVADRRVININSNTNGWRGIRDLGIVLRDLGENQLGDKYVRIADDFGNKLRAMIDKSINRKSTPPFVPFALGEDEFYPTMTMSTGSNYYMLVMPYFFESDIFEPKADPYTYTLEYMWAHQGVMAGLNRFGMKMIHPLYTWGREYSQISRHETRRALYTFYCALAHGYSRGTFVTGETLNNGPDRGEYYRLTHLPPEPPANGLYLRTLRHILIHEYDKGQDGRDDELWLLSSAPQKWLENGKSIKLKEMPTRFGPVSLTLDSKISDGQVIGTLKIDKVYQTGNIQLFVRLPKGLKVTHVQGLKNATIQQIDNDSVINLPIQKGDYNFTLTVS